MSQSSQQPTPDTPGKPQKQKLVGIQKWRVRIARIIIITTVLLVIFRIALVLLLPTAIRRAADFYGLNCEYGRAKLGLFGGYAALWDVVVTPKEGGDPVLQAKFCEGSISTWALLRGRLAIWRIGADDVSVNLVRSPDGSVPLLARLSSPPATQPVGPARELDLSAPFQIEAFRLTRTAIHFVDQAVTPELRATISASISVSDIGLPDRPAMIDIVVRGEGLVEDLRIQGQAQSNKRVVDAQLRLDARGIQPEAAAGYLRLAGLRSTGEILNLTSRLALTTIAAPKSLTALRGKASLTRTRLFTDSNVDVIKAENISLEPSFVDLGRIDLGRVQITDVSAALLRNDNGDLVFAGLSAAQASPAAPATQPATVPAPAGPVALPWKFSLEELALKNIRIAFTDLAIPGHANLGLVLNELQLTNLATYASTQPAPVALRATLQIPDIIPTIKITADADPFAAVKTANLKVAATGIKPIALKPYLEAAGLESTFANGQFNAELTARFQTAADGTLQGGITLHDFSLRDAQPLFRLTDATVSDCQIDPETLAVRIGAIDVVGPTLLAHRDAQGRILVLGLRSLPLMAATAPTTAPTSQITQAAVIEPRGQITFPIPRIDLGRFTWKDIRVQFTDESVKPATELSVTDAGMQISDLSVRFQPATQPSRPGQFSAWMAMPGLIDSFKAAGTLDLNADSARLKLDLNAGGIVAKPLAPYLESLRITPELDGGNFTAKADLAAALSGEQTRFDLALGNIALSDKTGSLFSLKAFNIDKAVISPDRASIDRILIKQPALAAAREADQSIRLLGLRVLPTPGAPANLSILERVPSLPRLTIRDVSVQGAAMRWTDRLFAPAVELPCRADLTLQNVHIGERSEPAKFDLRASAVPSISDLRLAGTLLLAPDEFSLAARLGITGIKSGPLDAYLGENLSIATRDGQFLASMSARLANHSKSGTSARFDCKDMALVDGNQSLWAINNIAVAVGQFDLRGEKVAIDELAATGIRASAQRSPEGAIELAGLRLGTGVTAYHETPTTRPAETLQSKEAAELIAESRKAFPEISLAKFLVGVDSFTCTDRMRPGAAALVIEDLQLRNADRLLWLGKHPLDQPANRFELSMRIAPVIDNLVTSLEIIPFAANPSAQARLSASGIRGEGLARLFPEKTDLFDFTTLNDGSFQGKLDLSARIERRGPANFDFTRGFTLDAIASSLELRNAGEPRPLLGLGELRASGVRIEPAKRLVTIPTIDITRTQAHVTRSAAGTRIAGITSRGAEARARAASRFFATAPTQTPTAERRASAPSAPETPAVPSAPSQAPFDWQVRKLTLSGLDLLFEDTSVQPQVTIPLNQLDADVSDFGTLSLKQPKPIRFNALIGSGKVPLPATKAKPASEREIFSLITANGAVALNPQPSGWIKASINGLELAAFQGIANSQDIQINNGVFDGDLDLRITGQTSAEAKATATLTDLSLTEGPNGPVARTIKLQVPLDSAIALLKGPDGSIALPIKFNITNGQVSPSQIFSAATSAAIGAVATGVATSPIKLAQGLLGGAAQAPKDTIKAAIQFAPGDASLSSAGAADLNAMLDRLRDHKDAHLTLRHELSESDASIAQARANPGPEDSADLVAGLRQRKEQLLRQREQLLVSTSFRVTSVPASESQYDVDRFRELNREIHDTDAALEKALDLFRPGADRQAGRRTLGASAALGQARLDTVKEYLLAGKIRDIEKRVESAPASGQPTTQPAGTVEVTLISRKK